MHRADTSSQGHTADFGGDFPDSGWLKQTREREAKPLASLSYYFFASLLVKAHGGAELGANHRAVPSPRAMGTAGILVWPCHFPWGFWEST